MLWIAFISSLLASYLCGSFPSGFIAGKICGVDLRKEGSGNVGATNAFRVLGKPWGYTVFAADALKGFLGVKAALGIAMLLAPGYEIPVGVVGAAGAVLGHNFPVWLGFQGGKGISTSAGVMLAIFPPMVFAVGLVAWMALFFTTRYVSVASLASAIALPATSLVLALNGQCHWLLVVVATAMCFLAFWRHRPNIARLMAGTEKRFERKKKDSPEATT